ncbi:MAG: phosphatidate cytidylyltransferase [Candidatus Izemoplasmatales bacterium]
MKTRIITGSVLTVILALFIYFGSGQLEWLFSGLMVLLATIAAFEFNKMLNTNKDKVFYRYFSVFFSFSFTLLSVIFFNESWYYLFVFIYLIGLLLFYSLFYVFVEGFKKEDFSEQILTIFYTSLGFIGFAFLRTKSLEIIVYLFLVSMLTDVFAYFIGVKFGKTRLAPKISPKKSVEGAIGGLVIGSLIAVLFAYFFKVFNLNIIWVILLTITLSIISQLGDLLASKFKREYGIKDYSQIFPGHGGVLDRFDSSMFAAIFLMLFVMVI